jgi:outer membrane protein assembly factor BamA
MGGGPCYGADFLEDAIWIVRHRLVREGFSRIAVTAQLWRDGRPLFAAHVGPQDGGEFFQIPEGDAVLLHVRPGRRDVFSSLHCNGIRSLDRRRCIQAFYPHVGLFSPPAERFFSKNRLDGGIRRLEEQLHAMGLRDARLVSQVVEELGHRRRVVLDWDEGLPHRLGAVSIAVAGDDPQHLAGEWEEKMRPSASDGVIGERLQRLRRQLHMAGHADARLDHHIEPMDGIDFPTDRLVIAVDPGPALRIGDITFQGRPWNEFPALRRHMTIRPGDPCDPDAIATDRSRLQAIGLAGAVDVHFTDESPSLCLRNVHFVGRESAADELYLRLGGGTYDLARIGIDWRHRGVRRVVYSSLLRVVQSFRRSEATYHGQVPWLCGEGTFFTWHGQLLRMEEANWVRRDEEFGCGLERYFPGGHRGSLIYAWSRLSADHSTAGGDWHRGRTDRVGSWRISMERSRLDNPLCPSKGDRCECLLELAHPIFGGDGRYVRLEIALALHRRIGSTALVHGELRHGLVHPFGPAGHRLPFNRRFFSGGANSVRGFRNGRATPFDENGGVVGATAQAIARGEWEQRITKHLSYFIFCDGIGFCAAGHRPDTWLSSVGYGLAFHTFVGPLRLARSWNWHRRATDSATGLCISFGSPL